MLLLMKTSLLHTYFVFIFIFGVLNVQAQTSNDSIIYKKPPKWSFKMEAGFGGFNGVGIQTSYFIKDKSSISLSFRNGNRQKDYIVTIDDASDSSSSHTITLKLNNALFSMGLSYGYLIQIPKTRSRLHIQTGIYYNVLNYPDDFERTHGGWADGFFPIGGSNYTYTMHQKHFPSLVIAPAFEFPLYDYFGLSLQPAAIFSKEGTYFMMNISIGFGNVTSIIKEYKY